MADPRIISRSQSNTGTSHDLNEAVEFPGRDDQFLQHDVPSRSKSCAGTFQITQAVNSPIRDHYSLRCDAPSRPQSSTGTSHQRNRATESTSWDHRSLQYQIPTEWYAEKGNSIPSSKSDTKGKTTKTCHTDGKVTQLNPRRHPSQHKRSHPYART